MRFNFRYFCSECNQPFYSGMMLDIEDPTADLCGSCLVSLQAEDDNIHDYLPEFIEAEIDDDEIKHVMNDQLTDDEVEAGVNAAWDAIYELQRETELALLLEMRSGWQSDPYLRDLEVPF